MNLNHQLQAWKDDGAIVPREEKIRETIELSKEVCFRQEQDRLLTWGEFLLTQFRYTRKRWWVLQAALLLLAWQSVPAMENHVFRVRSMGIVGCLFVVLMIPELWRNRESDSIQVEAACLYSLRQVYACRITLFGMVDAALLTLFSFWLDRMGFTLVEVLSQFLLPVTVTACICFFLLCGKTRVSENTSLAACFVWSGAWWMIAVNEYLYARIAPAVWVALFGASLAALALAVRKTITTTNQYWEVEFV